VSIKCVDLLILNFLALFRIFSWWNYS